MKGSDHPARASKPKNPKHTRPVKGSEQPIPGRCGAGLKNAPGRFCPNRKVLGRPRCRMHGGKTLVGVAHPGYKGGRSKYIPEALAAKYADALGDPALLSLKHELAVIDVRVATLWEAMGSSGSAKLWDQAAKAFATFRTAVATGKKALGQQALEDLDRLLAEGAKESATWGDLVDCIEIRRKLAESDAKIEKDLQLMVRTDKFFYLVDILAGAVKELVTDESFKALGAAGVQQAIYERIVRATGGAAQQPLEA